MKLAIGTAQFGLDYGVANNSGIVHVDEVKRILFECKLSGVDTLDTAKMYGTSELVLGQCGISDFSVVTKLPSVSLIREECNVFDWVVNQVFDSLKKLKINQVDAVLLHRVDDLFGSQGKNIIDALNWLRKNDYVKKIGLSLYNPEEFFKSSEIFCPDIIQVPYNIFDRRFYSSGIIGKNKRTGLEVHTRSVFLQGLLLMNKSDRPSYFSQWGGFFDLWDNYVNSSCMSALELCIKFCDSTHGIDKVVLGVDSADQLKQILSIKNNETFLKFPEELSSNDAFLINPSNWRF